MLILVVSHNISLTRDQRYKLITEGELSCCGVSVPVWFHKGSTTEPAIEIFCRYLITNDIKNPGYVTEKENLYYHINIPNITSKNENTEINFLPDINSLKDFKDGGSEYMYFKYTKKMSQESKISEIHHHVDINTIEELENSLL